MEKIIELFTKLYAVDSVHYAVDAVIKMVEDDRYCVDISHQLMATEGLLNNANRQVLTAHLKHCVNNADTEEDRNEKVDELINLMSKIMK